jgi:predicted O-linked N-acetylglucosamine transferase (SPINDLY family)
MPTDTGQLGNRFANAFDKLIDLSGQKLSDAVSAARAHGLDIAINLNGHTEHNRNELFDHRIAPIQVNYLGYAGTLGAKFMDYVVADHVVAPPEQAHCYTEQIARLPNSFFPCSYVRDDPSPMALRPTRLEQGLPSEGFIFSCFNNCYKITPDCFEIWMRLLKKVEGSVLWLPKQSTTAMRNLQQAAKTRGVAPERIIFASRMQSHAAHLARLGLADLFLDTRYYNAHTTAADALWAGLPVLTYAGESFASRVAASLLHAVGLPELMAPSMAAYESIALELASQPAKLQTLKNKLKIHRSTAPLFDIGLTTKNIEQAYRHMHQRQISGQKPVSFEVEG